MNNLKDIHNTTSPSLLHAQLFYQDFNEQFEGYTQQMATPPCVVLRCFIRISMNNLKDIHNMEVADAAAILLFYQDFNEQFEGYTQPLEYSSS